MRMWTVALTMGTLTMIAAADARAIRESPVRSQDDGGGEAMAVFSERVFSGLSPAAPYGKAVPRDYGPLIQGVAAGDRMLRGAMALICDWDHDLAVQDLRRLRHEFGADHVRLYFDRGTGLTADERRALSAWREETLRATESPEGAEARLEAAAALSYEASVQRFKERWAPLFEELDLAVVMPLGGGKLYQDAESPLWSDPELQEREIRSIVRKAKAWSDVDVVIGYDLVNEPIPPGSRPRHTRTWYWDWTEEEALEDLPEGDRALARIYDEVIRRIREFDKDRLIIIQPGPWGAPSGFPALQHVHDDPRLVFSFHQYEPHTFTHLGATSLRDADVSRLDIDLAQVVYPQSERQWSREGIREMFEFVRQFQTERERRTGRHCPVWIGEFGATRFPDGDSLRRWVTDTLELMEEYRFGYAWFVYTAGVCPNWDHFGQYGPEGDAVATDVYFAAHRRGDPEYFAQFRDTVRPTFSILAEFMRRHAGR